METALKLLGICLVAALFSALLKKTSPPMALLLIGAVVLASLAVLTAALEEVWTFLQDILQAGQLSPELFVPLLKTAAVALVSRTGAELCRDAGESAMAGLVETAGAFAAIVVSLPLFDAAWELLEGLL